MLQDGSVVLIAFGDNNFDNMQPVADGHVRGFIYPSGYLMQTTEKGTLVKYAVKVSSFGSLFICEILKVAVSVVSLVGFERNVT
jgi:hypothetical protein